MFSWQALGLSNLLVLAAAVTCFSSPVMEKRLLDEHQETVAAFGLANTGLLAKVYTNPGTRTWTLTLSNAEGKSCIQGYGDKWQEIDGIVVIPEDDEEVIQ